MKHKRLRHSGWLFKRPLGIVSTPQCFQAVSDRYAFQRRTSSDFEEAAAIDVDSLAVAFGDVQRNRLRGPKQLVPRVAIDILQTLCGFVRPSHVPDRNLVDIELYDLGGREVALAAADNYRYLRARGVTIHKTIDVIIASYCLQRDLDLLHSDRDFDAMERYLGLSVYRPA